MEPWLSVRTGELTPEERVGRYHGHYSRRLCFQGQHYVYVPSQDLSLQPTTSAERCPGASCPATTSDRWWIDDLAYHSQIRLGLTCLLPHGCLLVRLERERPWNPLQQYPDRRLPISVVMHGHLLWPGRGIAATALVEENDRDGQRHFKPQIQWYQNDKGWLSVTTLGRPGERRTERKLRQYRQRQPVRPSIPAEYAAALQTIEELRSELERQPETPLVTASLRETQTRYYRFVEQLGRRLEADRTAAAQAVTDAANAAGDASTSGAAAVIADLDRLLQAEQWRQGQMP